VSIFINLGSFCIFGSLKSSDGIIVGGIILSGQGDGVDTMELGAKGREMPWGIVEADLAEVCNAVALEVTDLVTDLANSILLLLSVVAVKVAHGGEDRQACDGSGCDEVFFVPR